MDKQQEEEKKLRERQVILDHYESLRKKQKLEGSYNPYRNGNVAPDDGKVPLQSILRRKNTGKDEARIMQKWGSFYYGMDNWDD